MLALVLACLLNTLNELVSAEVYKSPSSKFDTYMRYKLKNMNNQAIDNFVRTMGFLNNTCIYLNKDQKIRESIIQNSFALGNSLGNYKGCVNTNMDYYFLVFINEEAFPKEINDNMMTIYLMDISFYDYYSFSLCLPKDQIILQKRYNLTTQMNTNKRYLLFTENISKGFQDLKREENTNLSWYTTIFLTVFVIFGLVGLFFSVFPAYNDFKAFIRCGYIRNECKTSYHNVIFHRNSDLDYEPPDFGYGDRSNSIKRLGSVDSKTDRESESFAITKPNKIVFDPYEEFLDGKSSSNKISLKTGFDTEKKEEQNKEERNHNEFKFLDLVYEKDKSRDCPRFLSQNQTQKMKKGNYQIISNIFDLRKNIMRLYKVTHTKSSIHSSYKNDNALGFVNGFNSLILLISNLCLLKWAYYVCPNTEYAFPALQKKNAENIKFGIFTFYFFPIVNGFWMSNSFVLAYKFMSHMRVESLSNKSLRTKIIRVCNFIIPQSYRYFFYVAILIFIKCISYFLGLVNTDVGPLNYFYKQFQVSFTKRLPSLILLIEPFVRNSNFNSFFNGIFSINILHLIDMHFFILNMLFLVCYSFRKNATVIAMILCVFGMFVAKVVVGCIYDYKYRNVLGVDPYEYYSIYYNYRFNIISVLFGLMYYEFNVENGKNVLDMSNLTDDHVNNTRISGDIHGVHVKENSQPLTEKSSYLRRYISALSKSNKYQNLIIVLMLSGLNLFIYENYAMFFNNPDFDYSKGVSLYSLIIFNFEWDFSLILFFNIFFKFVIFKNTVVKRFLLSTRFIPLARIYYCVLSIQIPVSLYILLDFNTLIINDLYMLFLPLGVLFIIHISGLILTVVIEVPLKILFKTLKLKEEEEEVEDQDHL